MYKLDINIVGAGHSYADGSGASSACNMWYTLTNEAGEKLSWGFGPESGVVEYWPTQGEAVLEEENPNSLPIDYLVTVEITKDQYDAMKDFGENPSAYGFDSSYYWAPTNSCVDFVWKALEVGGLNPLGYEGVLMPIGNKWALRRYIEAGDFAMSNPSAPWLPGIDVCKKGSDTIFARYSR